MNAMEVFQHKKEWTADTCYHLDEAKNIILAEGSATQKDHILGWGVAQWKSVSLVCMCCGSNPQHQKQTNKRTNKPKTQYIYCDSIHMKYLGKEIH
jgi:hypothetical protein